MTIDTRTTHRTGARRNVFLDLGFSPREAKRLLAQTDAQIDECIRLKQQLMDEIAHWITESCVTQAVAAEVLHVTRPRVSDVVNHKVSKFTIDALVAMLARIGKQVRLAAIETSPRYPGVAQAGGGGIAGKGGLSLARMGSADGVRAVILGAASARGHRSGAGPRWGWCSYRSSDPRARSR